MICFTGFQEYLPAPIYSLPHPLRSFISLCHTPHSQLSEIPTTKADMVSQAITTQMQPFQKDGQSQIPLHRFFIPI